MEPQTLSLPIKVLEPNEPHCVNIGTPVAEAISLMQEHGFGCVLVVDQKRLVGIVTERDIVVRLMGQSLEPTQVMVEAIMTSSPETLSLGDPMAFALNIMHLGKYRHIPLVDEDATPVGIISTRDIVNYLAQSPHSDEQLGNDRIGEDKHA